MLGAALAVDWAQHAITVNTVGPGVVDTPMSAASLVEPRAPGDADGPDTARPSRRARARSPPSWRS